MDSDKSLKYEFSSISESCLLVVSCSLCCNTHKRLTFFIYMKTVSLLTYHYDVILSVPL